MTELEVKASGSYKIIIGKDLISKTGAFLSEIANPSKVAIITDDIVDKLYAKRVEASLDESGFEHIKYVFENGEKSKNGQNFLKILEFLAENHITRSDYIIALGGGVVGDLAGFVASAYLRGIKFIQIPTTLLAAVDSSVGGKTAIDLEAGKNLAGAFYQPSLVICDYSTLSTLDDKIFTDGCAEVIKYAVIGNKKLLEHLKTHKKDFDYEYVISECVKMKSEIVGRDEFDKGERQLLNLGHTIGHAVELCSDFKISHGSAVSVGLAMILKAAVKKRMCNESDCNEIITLLKDFSLPVKSEFSADDLYSISLNDKKRSGDKLNLIVPIKSSESIIFPTTIKDLKTFIEFGV